jgi:hypothetical protein
MSHRNGNRARADRRWKEKIHMRARMREHRAAAQNEISGRDAVSPQMPGGTPGDAATVENETANNGKETHGKADRKR